jgi:hypothetical protein
MNILIQNGRVIDPANGVDQTADVAIAAGRIVAVGQVPADFTPNRTIDAQGPSWPLAWWTWQRACASLGRNMRACWKAKWPLPWPVV